MGYTQAHKLIAIDTPLGKDELLLARLSGSEGVSRLFTFDLELLSENHEIDFKQIIGKPVTVRITLFDGKERFFHGIVSRFAQKSGIPDKGTHIPIFSVYTATMVPWLWLLTRTADSRIFQNQSIPEIIAKIFSDHGFADYELRLSGSYEPKEYCAQYRETDFNFVSRLMEQEGIFYYFKHESKKHTLIIGDSADENNACPNQKEARYQVDTSGLESEDTITSLELNQEIRVAKYTVNDYNFKVPNTDLKAEVATQNPLGPGEREVYDYPAKFNRLDEGDRLANFRIQEEERQVTTITGSSRCRDFSSGFTFDLQNYYRADMNGKTYVLTAISHEANEPVDAAGHEAVAAYGNRFTCIPLSVPFRPSRVTPRPVVEGTQSAIVVGPSGEEIYPDEYGRVKVRFIWDREGKKDENASCWIRVSQQWAGAGWGAMFIPHVGHEVIVDFVEGDPDRPIIIGSVYNGNNQPGDPLPDNKTRSVIRSHGDNDIVIEDKEGDRHIQIKQANGNEIRMHESTPNIEIKQACGNEILMHASEGIQIRDKFGNEVVLDAVAGTLKLRSPSHESTIELGKSIWLGTMSDIKQQATGNLWTTIHGSKSEYVVGPVQLKYDGINAKIHGGLVSDTFIGGKHTAYLAVTADTWKAKKYEFSHGTSYKRYYSKEDHVNFATKGQRTKGPVVLDSDTKYHIVGGDGDASNLVLQTDQALLSSKDSLVRIKASGSILVQSEADAGMVAKDKIYLASGNGGKPIQIKANDVAINANIKQKNLVVKK